MQNITSIPSGADALNVLFGASSGSFSVKNTGEWSYFVLSSSTLRQVLTDTALLVLYLYRHRQLFISSVLLCFYIYIYDTFTRNFRGFSFRQEIIEAYRQSGSEAPDNLI